MKGNVLDLAVAFIMGLAFGKIITSFVNDILMPPIGRLLGGLDFSNMFVDLSKSGATSLDAAKKLGAATINYGLFINTIIDFLIVAFVLFLVVRAANRLTKKPAPVSAPTTKDCPHCLMSVNIKATRCPYCTSEIS
jgi:large conductance mechanosensitive channel